MPVLQRIRKAGLSGRADSKERRFQIKIDANNLPDWTGFSRLKLDNRHTEL